MGKIYFQTLAYNAERTLKRCVDSVLNQSKYGEYIEYWFCENGSTDRTREMIEQYAHNDHRIKLFYNEKNEEWNTQSLIFWDLPTLIEEDSCFCVIDSDDEYKLDFLEKIIPFIRDNNLDFAIAGNDFIDANSGEIIGKRVLPQTLLLDTPQKFADYFPIYHQFARTIWSKIYTGKIAKKMITWNNCPREWWDELPYGFDTMSVFSALRQSKRVGIFPETFYKYSVSHKSLSHEWNSGRFKSDQILNEEAEDFLKQFGLISQQNHDFLDRVYANAVSDSLMVLNSANGMTAADKLKEMRKAVDYRVTGEMMKFDNDDIYRCRRNLFNATLNFGLELKEENEDFRAALTLICPNCTPFVEISELALYARDAALQNSLFSDDLPAIVKRLLELISKGSFAKQFDLFGMVSKFSAKQGFAGQITDAKFIKKYSDIFFMLWQKKYVQVLDKMSEILFKGKGSDETFLQVYLTLAAMLESVDEFVLGKERLAAYYCNEKRFDDCKSVLADLADMGIEDNDEITEIKNSLLGR